MNKSGPLIKSCLSFLRQIPWPISIFGVILLLSFITNVILALLIKFNPSIDLSIFDPDIFGSFTDWLTAFIAGVTGYYIWRTLKSQQEVQKLQTKQTKVLSLNYFKEIQHSKPEYEAFYRGYKIVDDIYFIQIIFKINPKEFILDNVQIEITSNLEEYENGIYTTKNKELKKINNNWYGNILLKIKKDTLENYESICELEIRLINYDLFIYKSSLQIVMKQGQPSKRTQKLEVDEFLPEISSI